jgi:hypothetical protein
MQRDIIAYRVSFGHLSTSLTMNDWEQFEARLLASIPYRFRYNLEDIIRAFHDSKNMLQIYIRALQGASLTGLGTTDELTVVAFGSFGRLDV